MAAKIDLLIRLLELAPHGLSGRPRQVASYLEAVIRAARLVIREAEWLPPDDPNDFWMREWALRFDAGRRADLWEERAREEMKIAKRSAEIAREYREKAGG